MSKKTVSIDGKPVAAGVAEDFQKLATAFEKKFGVTLHVRSGLRDSAEQERIFLARFKAQKTGSGPYRDVKVWKKVRYVRISSAGTVAVPGTSGHERGRDLDIYDSGTDYGVTRAGTARSNWIKSNAKKYGFKPRGLTFGEPWHIESTRKAADYWKRKSPAKAPKPPKPKPPARPTPGSPWFALGSWNISLGNSKGIKTWPNRRASVLAKIKAADHEILCLQEAYLTTKNDDGLKWLDEQLTNHTVAITKSGRAILTRKDVTVLGSGVFDLKTRATGHPKKYATWAHVKVNGYHALIVNAHAQNGALWSSVRRKWANELGDAVEQLHVKRGILRTNVFLAGDWNGREAAEEFAKRGWIDAASQSIKTLNQVSKTLNSWKRGLKAGPRIDYLLAPIGRPLADVRQHDDSSRVDHNYQTFLISHYRKI